MGKERWLEVAERSSNDAMHNDFRDDSLNDAFGNFSGHVNGEGEAAAPGEFTFMTDNSAENGGQAEADIQQPHHHRRRMSPQHIRRIKRRRRRRRIMIGIGVLLLVLIGLVAWFGASAMKVKTEVQQAVASASGMQETIMSGDSAKINEQIATFTNHANNAYRQTSSPLWAVAARVPYIGADISAVRTAVTAMENVSTQGLPALTDSLTKLNLNSITVKDSTIAIPGLKEATEGLKQADSVISTANQSVIAAPTPHVAQVADAMTKAKEYLASINTLVHNASVFAQVAPGMLANDGQTRTYLILAQTNAEIRPTGGMPGSWGTMTVTNGKVDMQEFVAETTIPWATDPVIPLTAEERSLFTDKLGRVPQDVNFTPDFPRTGEIAKAMWASKYQTQVDGVIAIDPVFLQNMLAVTGGVTLEDGTTIDGTNAAKFLLSDVYAQQSVSNQDAYFSAAAASAFKHIVQQAGDPKGFMKAITTSITQGHMLVWSGNADEQKLLETTEISGNLVTEASKPQVGVYFSDITQSKMDWYLKREITTSFDKVAANGANQYTVHIKLTNMMTADEVAKTPQYVLGDQLQGITNGQIKTAAFVYAPAGGRLVDWTMGKNGSGEQFDGITVHDGLTLGVKTFLIGPGESYEITVHVQSAPGVQTPLTVRQTPQIEGRTDK